MRRSSRRSRSAWASEVRVCALDDAAALDRALQGVPLVLHCAGPYKFTSKPMADACLRAGVHYLDITGEIPVFEALAARDAEAKARKVMLLPAVGFDVVPTDCLAVHLKRRLPSATRLALAIPQHRARRTAAGHAAHDDRAAALRRPRARGRQAGGAGARR